MIRIARPAFPANAGCCCAKDENRAAAGQANPDNHGAGRREVKFRPQLGGAEFAANCAPLKGKVHEEIRQRNLGRPREDRSGRGAIHFNPPSSEEYLKDWEEQMEEKESEQPPKKAFSNDHSPLVLHIPHSSTVIPDSVRPTLLLTESDVQQELLRMTDAYTDELFCCDSVASVRCPVSRIIVGPERFENDADEVMSQVDMGVVYTSTCDRKPLRHEPTPSDRETLLAASYRPHHAALTDAVARAVRQHGRCLVVDCHSFPSHPLPYELTKDSKDRTSALEPTRSTRQLNLR